MLPEYESKPSLSADLRKRELIRTPSVVHHFPSADAARKELPPLFRGENVKPSSGVGSNVDSEDCKVPRAVVVGAGFSRDELDEMRTIEGADSVPWLYPDPIKSAGSILTGPFLMTVIVKRAKSCLQTNGVAEGKEPGDMGVWPF